MGARKLDRGQVPEEDQVQDVAEGVMGEKAATDEVVGALRSWGAASLPCANSVTEKAGRPRGGRGGGVRGGLQEPLGKAALLLDLRGRAVGRPRVQGGVAQRVRVHFR